MSFSSLWPLIFIGAIPVIIILYLLKPKGKDVEISSNLLWKHIFKNEQSKTFFEKFIHEILMYLQILVMFLLILALMAPFVMTDSLTGGSTVIVIDNSFSMQHLNADGKTRLDEAKAQALDYVAGGGEITVISASDSVKILISNSQDRNRLRQTINGIEADDTEGDASDLYSLLSTIDADHTLILTDGYGCDALSAYAEILKADVIDTGDAVSNVSLDYVFAGEKDGKQQVSVRFTDYSDAAATMDVSLYDVSGNLIELKSAHTDAGKSGSVLFENVPAGGDYYRAEISSIQFDKSSVSAGSVVASHDRDSLSQDNAAYALTHESGEINGMLVGGGNTFIERAFFAVTGNDMVRAVSDNALEASPSSLVVYDAGMVRVQNTTNSMEFMPGGAAGTLSHVTVNVKECELTEGLGDFNIGANEVSYYDVPEWAESFMEVDDKCVGYYGMNNGHREVVVGFDIRESDFALKAEFPVFIAESVSYLSDMGMLAKNTYETGESMVLNPLPEYVQIEGIPMGKLEHAGVFYVTAGLKNEYYVVASPALGRDGKITSEDLIYSGTQSAAKAKKSLCWILLAIALILLIIEWVLYVKKMNYRKKFYLILRIVIMILVILSMLGIRLPRKAKDVTTVFVVDYSVSDEENMEAFEDFIDDALKDMPANNKYAIVGFGRDAVVDQFVTDRDMFMGLNSAADDTATNYEKALQRAISLIPADSAGRIVVLTDGKQTAGDIENTASMIRSGEISLEAYVLGSESGDDCYIESVDMPDELHPGDKYYMTVALESNFETDAVIKIMSGETVVTQEAVHLRSGHNEFIFEETVTGDSLEQFTVEVEAAGDTCAENDVYDAYSEVTNAPKILVLRGNGENYAPFEALLSAINVNAEIEKASNAPETLNDLLVYRAVIIENAYYGELPEGFLDNLETYVKDYGRGVIMTGGEDSFMLGGYNDTVVETVLPVNMELRSVVEVPKTAIVMVIDHSGSMDDYAGNGFTILDMALEASKRAVDNMRDTDDVGVLAFDDYFKWYHPISDASDKQGIKDDIDSIPSGGGTVIMPALEEARAELKHSDAQVKHIILLTDGMGETDNFSSVISKINADNVTLSTVAVGQYSDTALMADLAKQCGGRYYYADGNTDLPRIFSQEVFMGGNTYIKNGDYSLSVASSDITNGLFENGWFNILGYVAGSPKTGAQQLVVSDEGDPVLTAWQYGLGRTIAWNTSVDGGWTAAYSGNDDYAELWRRMIDYVTGTGGVGEDRVDVKQVGEQTVLEYYTDEYTDGTEITAIYTSPDGETGDVNFTASEPGVYRAVIDSTQKGLYNINVRRSDDGTIQGAFTTASVVQYSDEYRFDITDKTFRNFVENYGFYLTPEDNIWKKLEVSTAGSIDLTNFFIILAMLLFLADIAGRRFGWEPARRGFKQAGKKQKQQLEVLPESAAADGNAAPGMAGQSANAQFSAQTGQVSAPGSQGINMGTAGAAQMPAGAKANKGKASKKKEEPANDTLDTSALLKKKRERNNG